VRADRAAARHRVEAAGVPVAQVRETGGLGGEPRQERAHGLLRDEQVGVVRLLPALARGHAGADREARADEVVEQRELPRLERRDLVVAGHDGQHGAHRARRAGHRVGAGDREAADPRREAGVAEVDQARHALRRDVDDDVAVVRVVVHELRRKRRERRRDDGLEAVQDLRHEPPQRGVRDQLGGREVLGGGDEVPRVRAAHPGMPEAREAGVHLRDGPAEVAEQGRRVRRRIRVELAGDEAEQAHAPAPRDELGHERRGRRRRQVAERGVLEVEPRRVAVLLQHVAPAVGGEQQIAVELADERHRLRPRAEHLLREPERLVGHRR
jgi:hypothetical protein